MVPQVAAGCVGITELFQIVANTLLELVGTYVCFDHSKNASTLAIADLVEQFLDLFWRADFSLDGMRALQSVSGHSSTGAVLDEVLPDFPLWIRPVDHLVGHKGREALVEPEIVPPFHRDEIAEPHVSNLMRDYLNDALLSRSARVHVGMQQDLSESYRAPVLHRPISELGDSNQVKLGQII